MMRRVVIPFSFGCSFWHTLCILSSFPQRNPLVVPSVGAAAKKKTAPKNYHQKAVSTEGAASIPNEVFNFVKAIVGVGVLSLQVGNKRKWDHAFYVSVHLH
jgi:hypothetical protein